MRRARAWVGETRGGEVPLAERPASVAGSTPKAVRRHKHPDVVCGGRRCAAVKRGVLGRGASQVLIPFFYPARALPPVPWAGRVCIWVGNISNDLIFLQRKGSQFGVSGPSPPFSSNWGKNGCSLR